MNAFAKAVVATAVAAVAAVSTGCSTVADLHARADQRQATTSYQEAHQNDDRTYPHETLENANGND